MTYVDVYVKNYEFFLTAMFNSTFVWLYLIYLISPPGTDIVVIFSLLLLDKALMNFVFPRVLRGNLDRPTMNAPWVITMSTCTRG